MSILGFKNIQVRKAVIPFVLDTPTAAESFPIGEVPFPITITKVTATVKGGTSITFNIEKRAANALNSSGTNIMTSSLVATQTVVNTTAMASPKVPAGNHLVFVSSALSGTVNQVTLMIEFI